jgi:SpoVK/Ycf46/Vps4 family AAA+-type ATPase
MNNKRKNDDIDNKKKKKYNDDLDEYYILDSKTNKCKNPYCDHSYRGKLIDIVNRDIKNIDDLLSYNKYYHCKLRKTYKDIDLKVIFELNEPLTELNKLVGMQKVKESIIDQIIFFLQKLNKKTNCNNCTGCILMNECKNVKYINDDMLHTVITGPPGVGKTELGKILGKVYKAMGVLSNGTVNIAKRSDLIAKYLGQTSHKTQDFIDKCKGGVMFIDEAYSLGNPDGRDSYSKECIDTLNQNLTERKDFLCIIAGYEEDLEKCFFSVNAGLKRRFSFKYIIDSYTSSELAEIFLLKINNEEWVFDGLREELDNFFKKNYDSFPRFGGDIETLFLKTKIMHSRRIIFKDKNLRKKINLDDINKGFDNFTSHRKDKDKDNNDKILHMYI